MIKNIDLNNYFNHQIMIKLLYDYVDFVKEDYRFDTIFDALNIETQQMSCIKNFIYQDAMAGIHEESDGSFMDEQETAEAFESFILKKEHAYTIERLLSSGDLEVKFSNDGEIVLYAPEQESGE